MYFRAYKRYLAIFISLLALLTSCGVSEENNTIDEPDDLAIRNLLHQVGYEIILPTYASFQTSSQNLVAALETYLTDLEVGNDAMESLSQAHSSWANTMNIWQEAEVYQVGPSAPLQALELAVGAMGLRNEIYSWPTVNSCRVDQEILEAAYINTDFFGEELTNVYGLDAAEYLLFHQEASNTCPSLVPINSEGTWSAVSLEELQRKRAQYVLAVAVNLRDRAIDLHNAWEPNSGNFVNDFATAGQGDSVYMTAGEALNDLSDALFYIEKTVKDFKIAKPAGILGCQDVSCPNDVESRFSRVSKDNIIINLQAAQKLFLGASPGTDAPGFDDILRNRDPSDLADTMTQNLQAAIEAAEDIDGTLYEAAQSVTQEECEAGNAPICHTYFILKSFTDDLKTRFVEILKLQLPIEASGDAD